MTLYHSTFRWFGALACTTTPMGQPYNWFPSSQLQHAERYSCRCSASRHTTRRGGLRAISCQAETQPERKDTHRKPLLPHLTGSLSYMPYFIDSVHLRCSIKFQFHFFS